MNGKDIKAFKEFINYVISNTEIYKWVYAKEIDYNIDPKWDLYGLYVDDYETT